MWTYEDMKRLAQQRFRRIHDALWGPDDQPLNIPVGYPAASM
jgi:hypothetical protein